MTESDTMSQEPSQRICFVIMGFGEKTAYGKDHKPRTLDLDVTYEAIIKPANAR